MVRRSPRVPQRIRRHRQHGAVLRQPDRRELELAGWRTTLEFRENHIRAKDGRLLRVQEVWHAEAERDPVRRRGSVPRGVDLIAATAGSADAVWARLLLEAELADVRAPAETAARAS